MQRKFNPIRIPRQLALKLPFHARPKASLAVVDSVQSVNVVVTGLQLYGG